MAKSYLLFVTFMKNKKTADEKVYKIAFCRQLFNILMYFIWSDRLLARREAKAAWKRVWTSRKKAECARKNAGTARNG